MIAILAGVVVVGCWLVAVLLQNLLSGVWLLLVGCLYFLQTSSKRVTPFLNPQPPKNIKNTPRFVDSLYF
jgi:hypothetical protein